MPRRITATEKWDDYWFRNLSVAQKCLWLWMLDHCDLAGVFDFDPKQALFQVGARVKIDDVFEGKVVLLGGIRYFIPKFIEFQQGRKYEQLNPENKAHQAIVKLVEKHGVLPLIMGDVKGMLRDASLICIGIGIGIGNGKSTDDEKSKAPSAPFIPPTLAETEDYMTGQFLHVAKRCPGIEHVTSPAQEAPRFVEYWNQRDWKRKGHSIKDWRKTAYVWMINAYTYAKRDGKIT